MEKVKFGFDFSSLLPGWLHNILYGRYQVSFLRQVGTEETLHIVFSENSESKVSDRVRTLLGLVRHHMIEHNEKFVLDSQMQLRQAIEKVQANHQLLARQEEKIAQNEARLRELAPTYEQQESERNHDPRLQQGDG